ncbi:hypothetical protein B7R22_02120 [Subtercola boreus]|uniref:Uncharacterized protein n=1 Tax=Subtercola boreus TaxID=120213 RepID=A0A3E0W3D9_9MICO|nr:hypothetical protein [Subtercola boreus]RFA16894.1 hypothetical protein B7R22_02120 [Subtercola boreus]
MTEAVTFSKSGTRADVDAALGVAATHHRFANGDLASILNAITHQPATMLRRKRSLARKAPVVGSNQ